MQIRGMLNEAQGKESPHIPQLPRARESPHPLLIVYPIHPCPPLGASQVSRLDCLAADTPDMATTTQVQNNTGEEYWKRAYDALDASLRNNINSARTAKRDVVAALLKTARDKREICIHRQWKIKLPGGDTVIVRDLVDKIAKWIKLFVSVGDVSVSSNPTIAVLPWAAVHFLLQVAISDAQVHESIVIDLETISRLISRYREFERIHLQQARESSIKGQMEESLTRLYVAMLKYLASAIKYFDTSTFGEHKAVRMRKKQRLMYEIDSSRREKCPGYS